MAAINAADNPRDIFTRLPLQSSPQHSPAAEQLSINVFNVFAPLCTTLAAFTMSVSQVVGSYLTLPAASATNMKINITVARFGPPDDLPLSN